MTLDFFGAVAGTLYIALTVAAQLVAGGGRTTLRRLVSACRWQVGAIATAAIGVIIHVADIREDGPIWPLLWVANFGFSLAIAMVLRRRRDLKGDEVMADAERIVRTYRPDSAAVPRRGCGDDG